MLRRPLDARKTTLAVALCAGLAALLAVVPAGCDSSSPAPLRIAVSAWPGYEFLFLAQERGFLADEGLEVQLVEFGSLADSRRAYVGGQVDGFGCTAVELVLAAGQGRDPRAVVLCDWSNGGDVIVAREGLRTPRDLSERRVGLELDSLNLYVLSRALERSGLTLGEVELVPLAQESLDEAWRAGRIDAAVSYPPHSLVLLEHPGAHVLFTSREIPGEVVDLVALDASVLRRAPRTGVRLARAFARAVEWARAHPETAWPLLAARESMGPEAFRRIVEEDLVLGTEEEQRRCLEPGGSVARALDAAAASLHLAGVTRRRIEVGDLVSPQKAVDE